MVTGQLIMVLWQRIFDQEYKKNVVVDDDLTPEKRQENKRKAKQIDAYKKWATIKKK